MTYRVKLLVRSKHGGGTREVTTNIAGCRDEDAARAKARSLYSVVTIIWVKSAEDKKGTK